MVSRNPVLFVWLDIGVSLSLLVDNDSLFPRDSLGLLGLGRKEGVVGGISTAEEGRSEEKPEEEQRWVEPRRWLLDDGNSLVQGGEVSNLVGSLFSEVDPDGKTEL